MKRDLISIFVHNNRTTILGVGNLLCFLFLLLGWWVEKITFTEIAGAMTVCNTFFITFIAIFSADGKTLKEDVEQFRKIKDLIS